MNQRRMIGVPVAFGVAALLAVPAPASAAKARRCGKVGYGQVLNAKYEESAPYFISMTHAEAKRIAARTPAGEFGSHTKAAQVPCGVAQSIASAAGTAWLHWGGPSGTVDITEQTYGGPVTLGRFHCTGRPIHQVVPVTGVTYTFILRERCAGGRGSSRIVSTFRLGTYQSH